MTLFTNFAKDESGAVTVDWVVLTAAIIGISIAVVSLIGSGLNTAASDINANLTSAVSTANDLNGTATGG